MEAVQEKRARHASQITAVSGQSAEYQPCSSGDEDTPICWICLDSSTPLLTPCKCPRLAHAPCLARWQLQSAGSRKETHCEFCDCELPSWKRTLTPTCGSNAPAVMNVNFDGRTYSFEVKPGMDGYRQFTEAIRRAFSLPDDSELNITFTCDEPSVGEVPEDAATGSLLTLQGAGAYDAAVHCASVSAARRMTSLGPSRTTSTMSEHMSMMQSPRAPEQSQVQPGSPDSSLDTSVELADGALGSLGPKRRSSGFGRKLRSAISDLLNAR